MRITAFAAILCVAGGARAEEPHVYDFAMLLAAESLIVMDVLQSVDIKNHVNPAYRDPGWREVDPFVVALVGKHPTDNQFIALGVVGGLVTAVVWYNLPQKWRWVAPALVIGYEGFTVGHNASIGLKMRL